MVALHFPRNARGRDCVSYKSLQIKVPAAMAIAFRQFVHSRALFIIFDSQRKNFAEAIQSLSGRTHFEQRLFRVRIQFYGRCDQKRKPLRLSLGDVRQVGPLVIDRAHCSCDAGECCGNLLRAGPSRLEVTLVAGDPLELTFLDLAAG